MKVLGLVWAIVLVALSFEIGRGFLHRSGGQAQGASLDEPYDYIIVGAGATGAVLARRLAEQGYRLLVLETGEDEHENPLTRWGYFFPSTFYSHLYRNFFTLPEPHVNNRRLYHMSTKALGGGTAVNAMVWTWGDRKDWDMVQVPGWTFEDILPYFNRSETYTGIDTTGLRGKDGPTVISSFEPNEITMAAVETASGIFELPAVVDNNGGIHESVAIVQRNFKGATIDTGERMGTWVAYLKPALEEMPDKLDVLTRSTVVEILFDGSSEDGNLVATGVRFLTDGQCREATATKEVIVSAGAYLSPKLLLLSGVGDCAELAKLDIPCTLNLPGVGKNMKDHINPGQLLFQGPPRADYDANIVAAYTRTGVRQELTPDVELGFIMGPPVEDMDLWSMVPSLYVFYSLWLNHDGVGSISLKNKDPLEDPVVVSGYLKTGDDEKKLVRLYRMLYDWASTMRRKLGIDLVQLSGGPGTLYMDSMSTDDDILKAAKNVLSTHWHVSQSCAMGLESDPMAVVDNRFRVYGISNLRVIDASSIPVLTNGHPMAVLVAMAERAADFIREDNKEQARAGGRSKKTARHPKRSKSG